MMVAQERFIDQYMNRPPYNRYITSVGWTTRLVLERQRHDGTRSRQEISDDLRRRGEASDERFISIGP